MPQWFLGAAGALLIAILAALLFLVFRDDGEVVETVESTTSTEVTTSTSDDSTITTEEVTTTVGDESTTSDTTAASSTTTEPSPDSTIPGEFATAVWPWFDSGVRYDNPLDAATGFARDYLEFADPVVGEFQQGDSRSGEVEIQPLDGGPITTVLVRQLGSDDKWWVLGAATANIVVEAPSALCEVSSPLTVAGEALAFEGNVEVQVRADGVALALVTTSVIGGGSEVSPFTGEVTFTSPDTGSGAVVFRTRDARDGGVWEASVIRISFGSGGC